MLLPVLLILLVLALVGGGRGYGRYGGVAWSPIGLILLLVLVLWLTGNV